MNFRIYVRERKFCRKKLYQLPQKPTYKCKEKQILLLEDVNMGKMREAWIDYVMEIPEDKRDKYRAGGVYGIWIEDRLVYIGKSKYML